MLDDARLRPLIDEFLHGANDVDAEDAGRRIYRLAWDFIGLGARRRNELYERNYLQSARSNRMVSQRLHSAAARRHGDELIQKLLDDARRRRRTS